MFGLWQVEGERVMNSGEVKYCPQCGAADVVPREITPSHIVELYCRHCGMLAVLFRQEQELVGSAVVHDPDSDSESW